MSTDSGQPPLPDKHRDEQITIPEIVCGVCRGHGFTVDRTEDGRYRSRRCGACEPKRPP